MPDCAPHRLRSFLGQRPFSEETGESAEARVQETLQRETATHFLQITYPHFSVPTALPDGGQGPGRLSVSRDDRWRFQTNQTVFYHEGSLPTSFSKQSVVFRSASVCSLRCQKTSNQTTPHTHHFSTRRHLILWSSRRFLLRMMFKLDAFISLVSFTVPFFFRLIAR